MSNRFSDVDRLYLSTFSDEAYPLDLTEVRKRLLSKISEQVIGILEFLKICKEAF